MATQEALRSAEKAQAPLEMAPLVAALIKAQGKMPNASLNKTNPHFKSKYADLAAIRDATLPALNANGLAVVQFTSVTETGDVRLHTRLAHTSGEWIESVYPIQMDKPQAMGSALTYARRYSWAAMCGITAEEDDDANAAQASHRNGVSNIALGRTEMSKKDSRPVYEALINEMREFTDAAKVTAWALENTPRIYSMHDEFQRWFRNEYQSHLTAIKEGVTEEGTPIKQQLKASLEAEDAEAF